MAAGDVVSDKASPAKAQWKFLVYFTAKRHLVPLVLACACSLICGIMVPVLAVLLGVVFNELASFGSESISNVEILHNVSVYSLYLVALGSATWAAHTVHFGLWVSCGQLQAKTARETLFDALLRADLEWFETTEDGVAALLPRIQTYVTQVVPVKTLRPGLFMFPSKTNTLSALDTSMISNRRRLSHWDSPCRTS